MVTNSFNINDWVPFVGHKPFSKNMALLIAYGFIVPWIVGFLPLPFLQWGLPATLAQWVVRPWSSITYFIASSSFFAALSAGLWLYYFGKIGEDILGNRRLNQLFWIPGIAVGIIYLVCTLVAPQFTNGLLSASVAVSAIVYAVGYYFPTYRLFLFGAIELELRWLAVIKVVFDILTVIDHFSLGIWIVLGGVMGLLLAMQLKGTINNPLLQKLLDYNPLQSNTSNARRPKVVSINKFTNPKTATKAPSTAPDEVINALLDKINKHGYNSLSPEEKQQLLDKSKEI